MSDPRVSRRLAALVRRDRLLAASVALLVLVVVAAVAAPLLSTSDPNEVDYAFALLPPGGGHLLGTDNFGRDVFTRVLYGGRVSLTAAVVSVAVIIAVGTLVGALTGFTHRAVDVALTRVMDVLLAFPRLVLAIAVAALAGAGLGGLVLALSVVSWPGYARIVRGLVLRLREEGYVVAARAAGTRAPRILTGHVLPAITGPVLVLALVDFGEVVLGVAALSFLGLGVAAPTAEWGAMLNESRAYVEEAPWMFLAPGVTIFLVVLAVNYAGDAVRDALDPRDPLLARPPRWRTLLRRNRSTTRALRAERVGRMAGAHAAPAEVEALTVRVGDRAILDAVSLTVRPGECVGLVGESGSGKSTLAAALLGQLRAPLHVDGGTVRLHGEDTSAWTWADWRPARGRHVALIGQDPMAALNPVLRIDTQIDECGTTHGMTRAEAAARTREVLAAVGLPAETGRRHPHELSGGMRQRVVIAMALVHRPRLIVADEPTTALDVTTQAGILTELARLRDGSGAGLLFVTHDLRLVATLADRIAVLHEGRIVEHGTVAQVFGDPRQDYTRHLVAAIPRPPRQVGDV